MNMYIPLHIHTYEYLNIGWGMGHDGVRSMYIWSMTEIRFFTLGQIVAVVSKYTR